MFNNKNVKKAKSAKSIFAWLLFLIMLISFANISAYAATDITASGSCGQNANWTLYSNGTLVIDGTGAMSDYTNGGPWYTDYNDSINKVIIKDGITKVGDASLIMLKLTSGLKLGNSVKEIGKKAFFGSRIEFMQLSASTKTMGYFAFQQSYVACAFFDGTESEWQSISTGTSMFRQPSRIYYNIKLNNFENIQAIVSNSETIYSTLTNSVLDVYGTGEMPDRDNATLPFRDIKNNVKKAVIHNGITRIGDYTFNGLQNLETIEIADSVEEIGSNVFNGNKLKTINIPQNVYSIGENAFSCPYLEKFTVDIDNQYYKSEQGVLFTKDMSKLIRYPQNRNGYTYVIPNTVDTVVYMAFADSKNITEISVTDNVQYIEKEAFILCKKLKKAVLPKNLTELNDRVFYKCSSLNSVILPNTLQRIKYGAFEYCSSLEKINLPNGITELGEGVFWHSGIKQIEIPDSVTNFDIMIY